MFGGMCALILSFRHICMLSAVVLQGRPDHDSVDQHFFVCGEDVHIHVRLHFSARGACVRRRIAVGYCCWVKCMGESNTWRLHCGCGAASERQARRALVRRPACCGTVRSRSSVLQSHSYACMHEITPSHTAHAPCILAHTCAGDDPGAWVDDRAPQTQCSSTI